FQEEPVEIAASPGQRPSCKPQLGQQSARHDQQRQVESESQAERGVVEEPVEPVNGLGRLTQLMMLEAEYRFGECSEETAFDGKHRHGDLLARDGAPHSANPSPVPPVASWGTS